MRGFIYKITNLINNKEYYGSTKIQVNHRFRKHISDYYTKYLKDKPNRVCIKLCDAFYEYGLECFIVEELEMVIVNNLRELNLLEDKYIIQYDSIENGYNSQRAFHSKKDSDAVYHAKMKGTKEYDDKRHQQYLKDKHQNQITNHITPNYYKENTK